MLVRKAFTTVPWMNDRLRRYRTFLSSRTRIFWVVALSREISCAARPRLFTSSMLRRDSVVDPASAVVSADPQLTGHPALRAAIDELFGVQAEYLDKT